MTRSFSASSSRPNASACSGVMVTVLPPTVLLIVLGRVATVISNSFRLEGDVDVADGDGHADLHVLLLGTRHRSGDEVANHAVGLATGTAVADAHSASAL